MGSLVALDRERFTDPKRFLTELVERLDRDFPGTEQICVIIASKPLDDDEVEYGTTSNYLKRQEKLWLIEMGRKCVTNY